MSFLNEYAGLISLLGTLAAFVAAIVPIVIFKKQRKYDEEAEKRCIERELQAEQRRKQEVRQDAQDRLKAKKIANESTLARLAGVTDELEEKTYLEMRSRKR